MKLTYKVGSRSVSLPVESLEEAIAAYCQNRDDDCLGASELSCGHVVEGKEPLARISYNGRVQVLAPVARAFTFDGDAPTFNGVDRGHTWNGFAVPFVNAATLAEIIRWLETAEGDEGTTAEELRALEPISSSPGDLGCTYRLDLGLSTSWVVS